MSKAAEEITVRKFLLNKYPTNKYFDCPVPKNYWEDMEEYAKLKTSEIEKENQELIDALNTLVQLKDIKEIPEMAEYYETMKPKAWQKARDILKELNV